MKRAKFKKIRNLQLTKALQFLAFALLMALAPALWAQDFPAYPTQTELDDMREWRGQNDGSFKITRDTVIGKFVHVTDGKVLKLYPVGNRTITKGVQNGEIFKVGTNSKLYIIGQKGDTLNFYGNSGNPNGPIPTQTSYQGAAIWGTGTNAQIWLKYVNFYGFITHTSIDSPNGVNYPQGGIVTMGDDGGNIEGECHMDHVTFKNSYGGPVVTNHQRGYGRIISFVKGVWDVEMDSVKIHDCIISEYLGGHYYAQGLNIGGMGSVIRSQGQVGGSLTMTKCVAYNNTYRDLSRHTNITSYYQWGMDSINAQPLSGQGGVVNWRSGRKPVYDPILDNDTLTQVTLFGCKFYNNSAQCGGAVATCAAINMDSTEIFGNEAERGGGVYFYTYNGTDAPYDGHGFRAIFGKGVDIHDNSASEYGGGAYLTFDASDDVGFTPDAAAMSPEFKLEINEGSEIHDNQAPKGAGIALRDACPYSHYNNRSGHNKWSLEYRRTVTVNGGEVYNNYADGTTGDEKMAGGGLYIEKYEYPITHAFYSDYTNHPTNPNDAGTINVHLLSGEVYNNSAGNDTIPGYGGGVYIASKFETNTILSTLNVNIGSDTIAEPLEIYNNEAYTDGGGVYVWYDREDNRKNNGTVTVKGGTIGKTNLATGNKALNGNGGGICVMSGTVVVENGHVDYNTANQNGGGIYLNDGNLTFTGGNVDQNEASEGNGGGICVMSGTVEVDGGHVDNNTANQNGGGIYLNDGNLTFTGGNVEQNEASEGNGGGICVMGGTVEVDGGQVDNNTANQKGGGIYLNGGDLTFTGGSVDQNEASNGDGGGICVESGNIVVSGGSVSNNEAKQANGGGISVLDGLVDVAGGSIEHNKAAQDGGGVYVSVSDASQYTSVYGGSSISYNEAAQGGGIYVDYGTLIIYSADYFYDLYDSYGIEEAEDEDFQTRITRNKALDGNGGGAYLGEGDIESFSVLIYDNEANGNGGGGYVDYGTFFIDDTKIFKNTAKVHGGGIGCKEGYFDVYGSDISHNMALDGNGGGLYAESGGVYILNWDPAEITILSNNKAGGHGGGMYNENGSIDITFANFANNEAGYGNGKNGNGGGIYCNNWNEDGQPNQRIFHANFLDNKAHGNSNNENAPLGCGGGIYMEKGRYYSEYSTFFRNTAQTSGGAIYCHDGELRAYSALVGSDGNGNTATDGKGGGIITRHGNITIGPCDTYIEDGYDEISYIEHNTAKTDGGGICNMQGDITLIRSGINHNSAEEGKGGGVFITGGDLTMLGGQINNNQANDPAGGYGGGVYSGGGTFQIMERQPNPIVNFFAFEVVYKKDLEGNYVLDEYGNLIIDGYNFVYKMTHQGLPVSPSDTLYKGVSYTTDPNWADSMYISNYANNIVEGRVTNRFAADTFDPTKTYYFKACAWYQCGQENKYYYAESPVFEYDFSGDKAMDKGISRPRSIHPSKEEMYTYSKAKGKANNRPRSIYPSVEENPFFMELTPLQQAIMANTSEADSTTFRKRKNRPVRDGEPSDIPEINYNTATYGGGICIDQENANLIFAGSRVANPKLGQINYNYASEAGGGIYIGRQSADQYGQMQMMGKCEVNYNRVPSGKRGGGIYLDGRLYVGDKDTDTIGTHGLKVDRNFAITKEQATFESQIASIIANPPTASQAVTNEYSKAVNNIFLPRNEYDYHEHDDDATTEIYNKISVITLLSDVSGYAGPGNANPYSHIGFSVANGFCPVVATSNRFGGDYNVHEYTDPNPAVRDTVSEFWLYNLMTMGGSNPGVVESLKGAVFEDSESYVAVHTRKPGIGVAPFRSKYIYLWGCWTHPVVMDDPETEAPMKGSNSSTNPASDPDWQGHYVITNPDDNFKITTETTDYGKPLVWEIYSPEGLAWFTSYVNGLNDFDEKTGNTDTDENHHAWNANKNPKAVAKIMNDLDMSAYLWVPIGSVQKFYITALNSDTESSLFVDSETDVMDGSSVDDAYSTGAHYYQGTFDGQGHIIKGLQGLYLTGIKKFGLFGYLADDAVVKNTFVDEGLFVSDDEEVVYASGGIAGTMKFKESNDPENPIVNGKTPIVSNSEARMTFDATYCAPGSFMGGLVGDMREGSVHSCMAMPEFHGTTNYMGGLVGKVSSTSELLNSFSNPIFPDASYSMTSGKYIGGLVGENNGRVENCYSRLQDAREPASFGWLAGTNNSSGVIKYCYAPTEKTNYLGDNTTTGLTGHGNYDSTKLVSGKYGFNHRDQAVEATNNYVDNHALIGGLQRALNAWVKDATNNGWNATSNTNSNGYAVWSRTMASPINDDYPVLQIADFNVVGSEDGIYMKYDTCVNRMWASDGKNFQSLTSADNPNAAMYLYNTNYNAVNIHNNTAARLYIHEDVGITQEDGKELTARVGVTFDNSNGTTANGGAPYDWHMFSSALQNVPMGLEYYDDDTGYPVQTNYSTLSQLPPPVITNETVINGGIEEDDYGRPSFMDPPRTTWSETNVGYFPTNTPYGTSAYSGSEGANPGGPTSGTDGSFDFYCYSEQHRHWINFKRQGRAEFYDHWYQDANDLDGHLEKGRHFNIQYTNEDKFQVGKGYMMGVSQVSMLMADGTLNNGDGITTPITNNEYSINPSPYAEQLRGTNLVGNPYQSYLDFDKLANDPANNGIIHNKSYYLFDADAGRYICYPATASDNQVNAPQFIHPHQGFFVKTANGGNLTFKNYMRSATGGQGSTFRGDNFNYPLVNLFCYDAEGHYDVTTVEMNRPELGGGSKLKDKRNGNSLIYARLEDEDYQTLFAPTGTSTVPVRFEPSQDGVYTMRWGTLHGDFHYLHLVDNMSGADVDMLRSEEYRFEATTSDYISRFKLVFEVTDVEENPIEAEATTFAFCMGDEIIVNGAGYLEVFDVQGRRLSAKRLVDAQSSVSLPNVATGIYFLRLSDDKQVRTQKMVINY